MHSFFKMYRYIYIYNIGGVLEVLGEGVCRSVCNRSPCIGAVIRVLPALLFLGLFEWCCWYLWCRELCNWRCWWCFGCIGNC